MKVMQIMPEFGLAGAETMCENLTVELEKRGIEVVVVSLYDYHSAITDRLEDKGIELIYLGKKPGLDLSIIWKLQKVFRKEKPDIIHTHRYVMEYAIPAAVICGVKRRIHTLHSIASKECTPVLQKLNNFFYHCCHVTPIALNDKVQETILERYHLCQDSVPIIFNGINMERCIVKKTYQSSGVFRFLHIGRFAEAKNHGMLLKAFRQVHDLWPETQLELVGAGELEENIRKCIINNGLEDCVKILGVTDDVYTILNQADAFVLSSLYEGMPMTLIEAMGTGLPIVTTNVGGIPSMIDNEGEGLVVDVCENEIVAAMMRMQDEDLRCKLGTAACKKAREIFSVEKMADRYLRVYGQEP